MFVLSPKDAIRMRSATNVAVNPIFVFILHVDFLRNIISQKINGKRRLYLFSNLLVFNAKTLETNKNNGIEKIAQRKRNMPKWLGSLSCATCPPAHECSAKQRHRVYRFGIPRVRR